MAEPSVLDVISADFSHDLGLDWDGLALFAGPTAFAARLLAGEASAAEPFGEANGQLLFGNSGSPAAADIVQLTIANLEAHQQILNRG
jgi:hypothetical protein